MKFFAAAIFLLIGGLIAFSSRATVIVDEFTYTPAQCAARSPVLQTSMSNYWDGPNNKTYAYYDGCEYYAVGYPALVTPDGYFADWYPTGRVKPSLTGSGSGGSSGTGGTGNGSGSGSSDGTGGGSGSSGSSGSIPLTGGDSGGSGGGSDGINLSFNYGSSTDLNNWGDSTDFTDSTGSTGSTGSGYNFGDIGGPTGKPGENTFYFQQSIPDSDYNKMVIDFFINNKECGNNCISYFDKNKPIPKPLVCEDISFNLPVPHKRPNCGVDNIAWYKDGKFLSFRYFFTKETKDFFNKKLNVNSSSSSGYTPNTSPFNMPGSAAPGYDGPYKHLDGMSPFTLLTGIETQLEFITPEIEGFHKDYNTGNDNIWNELHGFHVDSYHHESELLERLNTDDLDTVATDSVSKLSSNLMGLLNGQNVGGQFSEASSLMAQIGNGSDSPLLGKFLDSKLIPIVDTRRCDMPVFGRGTAWEFTLNSVYLYKLKQILTFIMYALTFWYLFDMLTNAGGRD